MALSRSTRAVAGARLYASLAAVLVVAGIWGWLSRSIWVTVMGAVVSALPLWWMPHEREKLWPRIQLAVTQTGAIAAVQLLLSRSR